MCSKTRREDVDFSPWFGFRFRDKRSIRFHSLGRWVWVHSISSFLTIPFSFLLISHLPPHLDGVHFLVASCGSLIPLWSRNLIAHNHPRHLDSSEPPRRHGPASPIPPVCCITPKRRRRPHPRPRRTRASLQAGGPASASADLFTLSVSGIQPAQFFHHKTYLFCSRNEPDSQSATLNIRHETVRVVVVSPGDTPPYRIEPPRPAPFIFGLAAGHPIRRSSSGSRRARGGPGLCHEPPSKS